MRNILANPIYAGMVSYGRKRIAADQRTRKNDGIDDPSESVPKPTSDNVKVVVSYEEWCQVQAQIRNNFRFAQATTHPLFQHLLYCSTCHHFLSAHGDAKGRTKYACENDREGRVKIGSQTNNSESHQGRRYYCGQQLWEQYPEFPVVQALDEAVREWQPVLDLDQDIKDLQSQLSHAEGVENREKADIGNPEKPYEIAKLRMDNAHARVEDLRKQLKDLETQNVREEELKLMLKKGFMEFYYSKRRTKEQRQGILQRLIRRIDVGPQELTVSWLFMNAGKRRIPRSVTDPKGGHGKPRKYDPGARKKGVSDDCIPERNASKKTPSGVSGGRLVEMGANRHSCGSSTMLLFKLVLEVVIGVAGNMHGRESTS